MGQTHDQPSSVLDQLVGFVHGRVCGESADGEPLVQWDGPDQPRVAQSVWMDPSPSWKDCPQLPVLLAFLQGREEAPVVVGLLARPARLRHSAATSTPREIRLESSEEIVLRCGKAKIALRADGRLEIRGGYLLSRSTGPHRIQGGSVHIN